MLINITKAVDGEFYPIEEKLSLSNDLLEGRLIRFASDCVLKGNYVVNDGDVIVDAVCRVTLNCECDLCLKEVELEYKFKVAEGFSQEEKDGFRHQYTGFEVKLLPAVEENFVLYFPSRILCKSDCKGLCHTCGVNLNDKVCNCYSADEAVDSNNPFALLKEMNIDGGASNGSTKG